MKNFKKAMKNFKKVRLSLGMKIIALLSCVALLSMGFASWWIIKVDTPATQMGSFNTYEVEEKNLKIDNFTPTTNPTITFGQPSATDISGMTNNYKWLVSEKDNEDKDIVGEQNLTASYTFDVWVKDETSGTDPIVPSSEVAVADILQSITLNLTPDNAANFNLAVKDTTNSDANYIVGPKVRYKIGTGSWSEYATYSSTDSKTTTTIDLSSCTAKNQKYTITVEVTFAWGTAFNSINPYLYYNAINPTTNTSITGTALTALGRVNSLLTGGTYTITYIPNRVD